MKPATQPDTGAWRRFLCQFLCLLGLSLATVAAAQEAAPANATPTLDAASIAASPAIESLWTLAPPKTERVEFRGLASFDQAGVDTKAALVVGVGHPVLAAITAASFLVNAAVINSSRESQRNSVQIAADKVLQPYEAVIADYRSTDLFSQALAGARRIAPTSKSGTPWQVAAIPVFSMTQDQKAIVLDSVVEVRPSDSTAPAFASSIRVVADPMADTDPTSYWNAQQGHALRSTSESLLAEAVRLALLFADGGVSHNPALGTRSLRFMQGGTEKVERADVLVQDCSRTVLRTLRGTLMSVPTRRPDDTCLSSAASTPATDTPRSN